MTCSRSFSVSFLFPDRWFNGRRGLKDMRYNRKPQQRQSISGTSKDEQPTVSDAPPNISSRRGPILPTSESNKSTVTVVPRWPKHDLNHKLPVKQIECACRLPLRWVTHCTPPPSPHLARSSESKVSRSAATAAEVGVNAAHAADFDSPHHEAVLAAAALTRTLPAAVAMSQPTLRLRISAADADAQSARSRAGGCLTGCCWAASAAL